MFLVITKKYSLVLNLKKNPTNLKLK